MRAGVLSLLADLRRQLSDNLYTCCKIMEKLVKEKSHALACSRFAITLKLAQARGCVTSVKNGTQHAYNKSVKGIIKNK